MRLDAYYYFFVLAQTLHFGQAAASLCITQQTLSKSIRQLEQTLNTPLIERNQQPPHQLTPAGQILFQRLGKVHQQIKQLSQELKALRLQKLNMGLAGLMPPGYSQALADLQRDHPQICLGCYALSRTAIQDALLSGHLELALSPAPLDHPEISNMQILKEEWVIVHATPATDWQNLSFILFPLGPPESAWTMWDEQKHPRHISYQALTFQHALKLCLQGLGALHIPRLWVREALQNQQVHLVDDVPQSQPYTLYLHQNIRTQPCVSASALAAYIHQH